MGENTKIEWAHHTINFWWGCEKVSEGCANCYAESLSSRFGDLWGKTKPRRMIEGAQAMALRLNARAAKEGVRYRVFSQSMSDFFETDHGQKIVDKYGGEVFVEGDGITSMTLTLLREIAFDVIDNTPNLDWLLVTKRPENIRKFWVSRIETQRDLNEIEYRPNVWLLTSVENQEQADKRIPELLKCRDLSPVLGLSCEPLLGPVDLLLNGECSAWSCESCGSRNIQDAIPTTDGFEWLCNDCGSFGVGEADWKSLIDWVIVGGESGHAARPMHPGWARSLRDQCQSSKVPFFFKQWGEWGAVHHPIGGPADKAINGSSEFDVPYGEWHDDGIFVDSCLCGAGQGTVAKVGKKHAGRILDGHTHDEFPLAIR